MPDQVARAWSAIREEAAAVLRLPAYGIRPRARAHIVILDAEDTEEALRLKAPRRWVIHAGWLVDETEIREAIFRRREDPDRKGALITSTQCFEENK